MFKKIAGGLILSTGAGYLLKKAYDWYKESSEKSAYTYKEPSNEKKLLDFYASFNEFQRLMNAVSNTNQYSPIDSYLSDFENDKFYKFLARIKELLWRCNSSLFLTHIVKKGNLQDCTEEGRQCFKAMCEMRESIAEFLEQTKKDEIYPSTLSEKLEALLKDFYTKYTITVFPKHPDYIKFHWIVPHTKLNDEILLKPEIIEEYEKEREKNSWYRVYKASKEKESKSSDSNPQSEDKDSKSDV